MSRKAFEFTAEEKKQIRDDVLDHGSFERAGPRKYGKQLCELLILLLGAKDYEPRQAIPV